MVHIISYTAVIAALFAAGSSVNALQVSFKNLCTYPIDLYSREGGAKTADKKTSIAVGGATPVEFGKDFEGHFRHGLEDSATLIEFSTKGSMNFVWYDISVIPARLNKGHEFCSSLDDCKANSQSKKGFNVPVQMTPQANTNGNQCRELTCLADGCTDAYLFPKDDTKTHACKLETDFIVTFCPSGSSNGGNATTMAPTTAPSPMPTSTTPSTSAPTTMPPSSPPPAPTTPAPTSTAPTTTPTPTTTPAPTPSVTQAPTATPAPSTAPAPSVPAPSENGKIHVPDVDVVDVSTPPPTVTQTPAASPKSTPAPTPTPAPSTKKPKKKGTKHCT